jgi:hypothetical protein
MAIVLLKIDSYRELIERENFLKLAGRPGRPGLPRSNPGLFDYAMLHHLWTGWWT